MNIETMRRVLADPRKWQGVDQHGAYVRDETTVIYVRDALPALLDVAEAARNYSYRLPRGASDGGMRAALARLDEVLP